MNNEERKYFVATWLSSVIFDYYVTKGIPQDKQQIKECNEYFYKKYPEVSQRTIRRSTQAIRENNYRLEMSQSHYTVEPAGSIVPGQYSKKREYIERMKELIARCKREHRLIRLANVQDGHREHADPALLDLVLMVLQDFDPDYVPMMCDMVDNSLFAPYIHGEKYYLNAGGMNISQAMLAFEEDTLDYARCISAITRPETIKPTWLGNHEAWILRFLNDQKFAAGYFFDNFFAKLAKYDVLWTEGDTHIELPVTDNVIALHGWTSRSGSYGATANGYLNHYGGTLSGFAGHSHRQETVWSKPHPNTGGQNFWNICGTLGTVRPDYLQHRFTGHVQGFSLAYLAPEGNLGHSIQDVRIQYRDGYYECNVSGKFYRNQATKEPEFLNPFVES